MVESQRGTTMIRRYNVTRLLASFVLSLSFSGLIFAQGFGTIVGTVTDSTGAVIPSAKVRVTDDATSISRETNTNDQGYYVVPALRPSTYTLTVEAGGFAPSVRKSILLQADQSLTVNQSIAVQQSAETIRSTPRPARSIPVRQQRAK